MAYIGIRLSEDILDKAKAFANQKNKKLSTFLRELIELGLKIEEMSDSPNPEKKLQALTYKATLESNMLSRAILRSQSKITDEEKRDLLLNASKKSQDLVEKYLGVNAFEDNN